MQQFDVSIIGAGVVGLTAAISFAQLGLSVAVVEQHSSQHPHSNSLDQRAIALSASSIKILQSLELWQPIEAAQIATPIQNIHVSDQGQFGFTRINANEHKVAALGQVVTLETLIPVLWRQLSQYANISVFCPAKLSQIEKHAQGATLSLTSLDSTPDININTQLVLAADGTFSKVAQFCGIAIERSPYQQSAVISNVICEKPHLNSAFERFTLQGPLAMLPLKSNQMGLVWCQTAAQAEATMSLSDTQFLVKLQSEFGYRLGKLTKASQRVSYPLSLHMATRPFADRVLLLGNACHTLHPIAGQGLNLALRDVAGLNDLLIELLMSISSKPGSKIEITEQQCRHLTQAFAESRRQDWEQTVTATDTLVRLFSQDFMPLVVMRNLAMKWVNRCFWSKQLLANNAMGFSGRSSRLARGLSNLTAVNPAHRVKVKDNANTI
ncbi:2-octaprenyl-6-methoxyphenyl hydroxylase [Aliikangiella sp. IMCC44632]